MRSIKFLLITAYALTVALEIKDMETKREMIAWGCSLLWAGVYLAAIWKVKKHDGDNVIISKK